MKNKILFTTVCTVLMLVSFTSCNSQTTSDEANKSEATISQDGQSVVTVYYFHGDRRCTTCKAVGSVSKETVASNFAEDARVIYKDVNIDEVENNEIKDKLEMSGSGLFIYDGTKKMDLTAVAFQKAVDKPEALSEKIVEAVNEML